MHVGRRNGGGGGGGGEWRGARDRGERNEERVHTHTRAYTCAKKRKRGWRWWRRREPAVHLCCERTFPLKQKKKKKGEGEEDAKIESIAVIIID